MPNLKCGNSRCFGNYEKDWFHYCGILSEAIGGECPFFKDRAERPFQKSITDIKRYAKMKEGKQK